VRGGLGVNTGCIVLSWLGSFLQVKVSSSILVFSDLCTTPGNFIYELLGDRDIKLSKLVNASELEGHEVLCQGNVSVAIVVQVIPVDYLQVL